MSDEEYPHDFSYRKGTPQSFGWVKASHLNRMQNGHTYQAWEAPNGTIHYLLAGLNYITIPIKPRRVKP